MTFNLGQILTQSSIVVYKYLPRLFLIGNTAVLSAFWRPITEAGDHVGRSDHPRRASRHGGAESDGDPPPAHGSRSQPVGAAEPRGRVRDIPRGGDGLELAGGRGEGALPAAAEIGRAHV